MECGIGLVDVATEISKVIGKAVLCAGPVITVAKMSPHRHEIAVKRGIRRVEGRDRSAEQVEVMANVRSRECKRVCPLCVPKIDRGSVGPGKPTVRQVEAVKAAPGKY